jgi:outer membrane PBP1 activator LpoA protein
MVRTPALARARLIVAALLLASVARGAPAQTFVSIPPAVGPDGPSIALILPSQQTVFAEAAEALRQGFFAADAASARPTTIQVLEVDDDPVQLLAVLDGARRRGVKVAVGPLPRAEVNSLIDGGGGAALPVVTLNYPERDAAAPPTLIALGLSAESEAQYVVRIALSEFVGIRRAPGAAPRFIVLSGAGALEHRIAQAYMSTLRAAGEPPLLIETATESPERLAQRFDPDRHEAVFLALDGREASLLRARIPRQILVFGTSLLNVGDGGTSPETAALAHDLDGIRFVDMPWLLPTGGTPPAGWPVPAAPLSRDLGRLFALGVDAYRVAIRWGAGETRFELEGMTGRLRVDRSAGPRVERTPAVAIYRNGAIEREEIQR